MEAVGANDGALLCDKPLEYHTARSNCRMSRKGNGSIPCLAFASRDSALVLQLCTSLPTASRSRPSVELDSIAMI